jgi:DinB superfamily
MERSCYRKKNPVDIGTILTAFGGSMREKKRKGTPVMAEHLMVKTVRTALWQQFSAAIAMLEHALLACPETLWQEHLWIDVENADEGTFWEITYHTLGCLDRFLTGCSLEALPALKKRADGVIPRDELHPYLVQLREQCQTTFAALSDEKASQPYTFPWPGGATVSYFELLLYTLRHVQEHAAQLSLFLGQHAIPDEALHWVLRAQEEAGL